MGLGIYKPGQGYWVRVLSAVAFGILTLATAAWVWGESALINLPVRAWQITLTDVEGALTPGETVTLLQADPESNNLIEAGTATVETFVPSEFLTRTTLTDPQLTAQFVIEDLQGVRTGSFSGVTGTGGSVFPIPVVDQLYVQGAAAGVIVLVGAILTLYFVGSKPSSSEFLIATDGEMKKVNWSTRREVLGSTWVVIGASFMIAAILYAVDYGFQAFFVAIDVLQR